MACNDAWHRIQIRRGAHYDKEDILRSILTAIEPADLIPVRYQISGDDAYFIARNCKESLENLCRSNLIINMGNGDPIVLVVTLAFASIHDLKINIQPILLAAITRRYSSTKKALNLENFHRDEEVSKTVYCPLSQVKTLSHTLKLAKTTLGPFEYLNLQRNELLSTTAFENSNLTSLKGLDLRHNYLMSMDALSALKSLNITELWLDGNPLCENYSSTQQYVESAKRYCPLLTKLDGVFIDDLTLPFANKNYFRKDDEGKLVNQFLSHFFRMYDDDNRTQMKDMYHRNAVYSMTLENAQGLNKKYFDCFINENRNIYLESDHNKRYRLLYRGPDEIVGVFRRMPSSLHDRKSFRCDVMFGDGEHILINVEGVFKLPTVPTSKSIFSFNRTFLLVAGNDNEYNIVNDQYHVGRPVTDQEICFDDKTNDVIIVKPCEPSPREKVNLVFTLMNVTTMKPMWCQRMLENSHWDPRRAIKNFMDDYTAAKLPAEAFDR